MGSARSNSQETKHWTPPAYDGMVGREVVGIGAETRFTGKIDKITLEVRK